MRAAAVTTPVKARSNIRQFMMKSSSLTSLYLPYNNNIKKSKLTTKRCKKKRIDIVKIKQENYRITNQCTSQLKTIKHLQQRIEELKLENNKLKSDHNSQNETLKKLKVKFLYVPNSEVLSKQCIELKSKLDLYKDKYTKLRRSYIKTQKQNKSMKHQLNNTNTALHNILSTKYAIKDHNEIDANTSSNSLSKSNSSSPCNTPVTEAMQEDIEKLQVLIHNLDYDKNTDIDSLQKEHVKTKQDENSKQFLNVKKIIVEHGSLQNDNRDLALEIVGQEETNAKLSQSVNDLWLFSNQLLLKMEKQTTWKNYSNRKILYVNEQLVTFKKMFHRARFYFSQLSMEYMKQLHQLKRIINELLHQNNEYKEELKENSILKIEIIELKKAIQKYESEIIKINSEKQTLVNTYETIVSTATHQAIQTKRERDILLHKLDCLMSRHKL
eukprot:544176_1